MPNAGLLDHLDMQRDAALLLENILNIIIDEPSSHNSLNAPLRSCWTLIDRLHHCPLTESENGLYLVHHQRTGATDAELVDIVESPRQKQIDEETRLAMITLDC